MTDALLPQDPRERFDVLHADGSPTGRTKARALVHRDGDWHRAVHVWVAGRDATGAPFLLFQRRGSGKDTWPGRLDATVGGHFRAGERLAEALREVEEEIGIAAPPATLRPLGTRVWVNESEPGILDHELQEVFLLRDDRPLAAYRPHPAELAALIRFPLSPLLALLAGAAPTIAGQALAPGAARPVPVTCTPNDFIPTVDRYFYRVAIATAAALRGEHHVAV
jgi:isopentenyldiphosphate isomerase